MKKITSIIITIILLASIYFLFFNKQNSLSDVELLEKAKAENSLSLCSKIRDSSTRNACYFFIANSTGNEAACDKISVHEKMFKDFCYALVAKKTGDTSVCDKVSYSITYSCKAVASKNSDYCDEIGLDSKKNECYHILAKETVNSSLCFKIPKDHYRRKTCINDLAVIQKIGDLCYWIIDSEKWRNYCYADVAAVSHNDSVCLLLIDEEGKNLCLGIAMDKEEYCSKLTDSAMKKKCYNTIALSSLNSDLCEKAENPYCYYLIALKTNNSNECNKIDDNLVRNECLSATTNDPSYCESIQNDENRDECFEDVGSKIKSTEFCYESRGKSGTLEGKLRCFLGEDWDYVLWE